MSWLTIIKKREEQRKKLQKKAIREIIRLVRKAKRNFKFDSVYLFGSVISDRFRVWSDIDLIVKGLQPEKFFKLHAFLLKNCDYQIDLKPYEELPQDYKLSLQEAKKIA